MSDDWGLTRLIEQAFVRYWNEPLLIDPDSSSSYGAAWPVVEEAAANMRELAPAGCAAVLLPNGTDYPLALLAIGLAGWTRTALNIMDSPESHVYKLNLTRTGVLITSAELLDTLGGAGALGAESPVCTVLLVRPGSHEPFEALAIRPGPVMSVPGEPVYQLGFTGGTTGKPKGVTLSPRNVRAETALIWSELKQPAPGDVFHGLTPYSNASGAFVLPFALRGAALSGAPRADVRALATDLDTGYLSGHKVTTFVVPTLLSRMIEHVAGRSWQRDPSTWFDTIIYGAAPTPVAVALRAGEIFGPTLVQLYAQAEVPMVVAAMRPEELPLHGTNRGACVGRPAALVEVWLRGADGQPVPQGSIGEVCARGDHVMESYWENPAETTEKLDGRTVRTNDLGYFDENGVLWIVGRNRDMIISGGFNVYPSQVESVLLSCSGVASAIVAGLPDVTWGEAVAAGVVLTEPAADAAQVLARLREVARQRLASFERPKHYLVLDTIPVTTLGKPDREAFKVLARQRRDEHD
jgi:acyl-CoA synthetase (AMP-forming)/AMP-acid ligase II